MLKRPVPPAEPPAPRTAARRWLLLVYQVPGTPSSLRVKVWRRLQGVGALAVRNSAYLLPESAQAREDLEWIRSEIAALGGQATVFAADTIEQRSAREIVAAFAAARKGDYRRLLQRARALVRRVGAARGGERRPQLAAALRRLAGEARALEERTYFAPPEQAAVRELLAELESGVHRPAPPEPGAAAPEVAPARLRGASWVSRPRPGIDRMATGWLIRTFVDPAARFRFADHAGAGETPFDMFEGEFGHRGERCTFEVLADRLGLEDPRVRWLGRIVHDLDLKDRRYAPPEAPGVSALVAGLRQRFADDAELLEQGIAAMAALVSAAPVPARARVGNRRRPRAQQPKRRRGGKRLSAQTTTIAPVRRRR